MQDEHSPGSNPSSPEPSPVSEPSVLETRFDDPASLADALADSIAGGLRRAVEQRGRASLVVSGGSTPLPLFERLAGELVPWSQVTVTLADERWVAPGREGSNESLVREHLLRGDAEDASFVGLWNDAPTPEAGWSQTEVALATIPRPFDIVVLGMGTDGHTASLFPGSAELAAGLDLSTDRVCLAVHPTAAPHPRMSLTLRALLDSHRSIIHITGDAKWQVYRRALRPGPVEELPVRGVLGRGREPIDVYWAP
ncbi:MAG: 6-phosphogluconolactonase [Acidobacteriota bacterium]